MQLSLQKDELDRDATQLQAGMAQAPTQITPDKLKTLSGQMQQRLADGPAELRQAYTKCY